MNLTWDSFSYRGGDLPWQKLWTQLLLVGRQNMNLTWDSPFYRGGYLPWQRVWTQLVLVGSHNIHLTWDSPSYKGGDLPWQRVWTQLLLVGSHNMNTWGSLRASTGLTLSAGICQWCSFYSRNIPAVWTSHSPPGISAYVLKIEQNSNLYSNKR